MLNRRLWILASFLVACPGGDSFDCQPKPPPTPPAAPEPVVYGVVPKEMRADVHVELDFDGHHLVIDSVLVRSWEHEEYWAPVGGYLAPLSQQLDALGLETARRDEVFHAAGTPMLVAFYNAWLSVLRMTIANKDGVCTVDVTDSAGAQEESVVFGPHRDTCSGPWKYYSVNGTLKDMPGFQEIGGISAETLVVPPPGGEGQLSYAFDLAWAENGVTVDLHADYYAPMQLLTR